MRDTLQPPSGRSQSEAHYCFLCRVKYSPLRISCENLHCHYWDLAFSTLFVHIVWRMYLNTYGENTLHIFKLFPLLTDMTCHGIINTLQKLHGIKFMLSEMKVKLLWTVYQTRAFIHLFSNWIMNGQNGGMIHNEATTAGQPRSNVARSCNDTT